MVHMVQLEGMVLMVGMAETAFGNNAGYGSDGQRGSDGPDLFITIRPIYSPFYLTKHWYIQKWYPN